MAQKGEQFWEDEELNVRAVAGDHGAQVELCRRFWSDCPAMMHGHRQERVRSQVDALTVRVLPSGVGFKCEDQVQELADACAERFLDRLREGKLPQEGAPTTTRVRTLGWRSIEYTTRRLTKHVEREIPVEAMFARSPGMSDLKPSDQAEMLYEFRLTPAEKEEELRRHTMPRFKGYGPFDATREEMRDRNRAEAAGDAEEAAKHDRKAQRRFASGWNRQWQDYPRLLGDRDEVMKGVDRTAEFTEYSVHTQDGREVELPVYFWRLFGRARLRGRKPSQMDKDRARREAREEGDGGT